MAGEGGKDAHDPPAVRAAVGRVFEHQANTRSRGNKYGKFTGGGAGLPWPRQLHNSINSRLARGDFSLRPIHQGLARYFGGFSAQLQIIAMVTDASHDNFVTSETRNSCLKKQASSRNGEYLFSFIFLLASECFRSPLCFSHGCSFHYLVKNVSVHQLKVIFSHIIFLPLTRNAVYV